MAKNTTTYTYTQPDGLRITFASTREVNYVALINDSSGWGRVKMSKNIITKSNMGQTGEQSRYFATAETVVLPVTVVEPVTEAHPADSAAASDLSSVSGPFRVVKVRGPFEYETVSEHATFADAHAAFKEIVVACAFPTYYTDADGVQVCVLPVHRPGPAVPEPVVSKYVQERLNKLVFGKGPNFK